VTNQDVAISLRTFLSGLDATVFSRSVDIMVSRLRQKLGDNSKQPRFIKTIWGKGYRFVARPLE